ncbi:MAG: DNA recombination protein RmuC [Candidatus Aminicenantes bacterium]|nr:DNA recombination protein RmuC [Candidatus Aminicenantes bacterium]
MNQVLYFIAGAVFGAGALFIVLLLRKKETREIARALVDETEKEKVQDLETLIGRVKDAFGSLSQEALKTSSEELIKLAREQLTSQVQLGGRDLDGKKQLIDQSLESMRTDLRKMEELVSGFERDRALKYGELSSQLRTAAQQTSRLQETADHLRQALVSTKARGQWGERMAEDVLRLAGFVEGVNYLRQKVLDGAASRPDYTFQLPQGRKVNMDVKFPLNSYLRYLETESEMEREAHKTQFLRDVRARIKEVTGRDYINPEDETLDYVLVFIPNEQVYAFINQNDPALLDEALKSKVILCSPFTLFAILAIIRQAMDNFHTEQTKGEMLRHLGRFYKEWEKFRDSMDKAGKKLDEARDEFQRMITTRRNKLEKPLYEIEDLRRQKGIEEEIALGEADILAIEQGNDKGQPD